MFTYVPSAGTILNAGTYTISASFVPSDSANYAPVTTVAPLIVNKAQASVSLSKLDQAFTGQPLPVLATTVPPGLSVTTVYNGSPQAPTAIGSYSVVSTIDAKNYSGSAAATLVIVGSERVTIEAPPQTLMGSKTLITATVSSTEVMPAGRVIFEDGSSFLGRAILVDGRATLETSALTLGSNLLTAIYSADRAHGDMSSDPLLVQVIDYKVLAVGPTQTIAPGGSVSSPISIVPTAGDSLPSAVHLSVTGLPEGVTWSVTPSAWVMQPDHEWTLAAGTPLPSTAIVFHFPAAAAHLHGGDTRSGFVQSVGLGLLLFPFLRRFTEHFKRSFAKVRLYALLAACTFIVFGLTACSTVSSTVVTVSSGNVRRSAVLPLIVNPT